MSKSRDNEVMMSLTPEAKYPKSKLTLLIHVYKLWAGQNYFTVFWQDVRPEETIQTLSFRQKIQESPKMAQAIFKNSICGSQEDKKSFT